jgi:hypothetical protein
VYFFFRARLANLSANAVCAGTKTVTTRVRGELPLLLPVCVDDARVDFKAKHFPLRVVLPEHHSGLDAPPRNVAYALHTLLHHTGNHYTGHGFVANGERAPYVFFHDANDRPLVLPANRDQHGVLAYGHNVARAWYLRVGVVE